MNQFINRLNNPNLLYNTAIFTGLTWSIAEFGFENSVKNPFSFMFGSVMNVGVSYLGTAIVHDLFPKTAPSLVILLGASSIYHLSKSIYPKRIENIEVDNKNPVSSAIFGIKINDQSSG